MRVSWKGLLAATAVLALALACANCGGGATGSNLTTGGGNSGSSGSGSGPGSGGSGSGGSGSGSSQSTCSEMSAGQGASLNGFRPFGSDNLWNQDISSSPVDPNSAAIINFIGPTVGMHADFGSGEYQGSNIGIPYSVGAGSQTLVGITFTAYGPESDPGPMPVPASAPIEGDPNPGSGDRHVLVLDNSNCFLYELYSAYPNGNGTWNAASAAVWDLLNNEQRPWTWTSADAAGLPIFPGLVRYDEVAAGEIQHAIRVTLQDSRAAAVLPATHWAGNSTSASAPPMGMRMRLKANYDIFGFSTQVQVILSAMKKYGLIMADNGSSMYISGAPDSRWNNDDLHDLGQVPASAFEVVKMDTVYTASNVPQGTAPVINSFTANPSSVRPGGSVTLSWDVSNAGYAIVAPQAGAVRGTSITVQPGQSTTYKLYATNQFGRTTATVNVTVQ